MDIAIRAIVIFGLLLIVTRAVGRRELSTMEPFDLILLVVLGDLIQQGVTQSDYSLTGTVIVLGVIAVMTVLTSYVSFRVPRLRGVLEGEPIVLVEHGNVIDRNLRRERMTTTSSPPRRASSRSSTSIRCAWRCSRPTGA